MTQSLFVGDALEVLKTLSSESVQSCITSPPYWGLRDYGVSGQLGLEKTPEEFVSKMVEVFREVRRVLKDDGTLWLNLGDSYCGGGNNRGARSDFKNSTKQASNRGAIGQASKFGVHNFKSETVKPKDLVGIPWRVAFALQADGWYLRQDIIWHKPNPMPESVRDRCTKAHEYVFLLSKSRKYFFDMSAILEPAVSAHEAKWANPAGGLHGGQSYARTGKSTRRFGSGNKERKLRPNSDTLNRGAQAGSIPWEGRLMRQKRSVWSVSTKPFKGAHFATFPPGLIEPCVLAGSREGDTVLDPFFGAGTTGLVAQKHGRNWIGIELNPAYAKIAEERLNLNQLKLETVS